VKVLLEKTRFPSFDFPRALSYATENEPVEVVTLLVESGHLSIIDCLAASTDAATKNRMAALNWLLESGKVTHYDVLLMAARRDCTVVIK